MSRLFELQPGDIRDFGTRSEDTITKIGETFLNWRASLNGEWREDEPTEWQQLTYRGLACSTIHRRDSDGVPQLIADEKFIKAIIAMQWLNENTNYRVELLEDFDPEYHPTGVFEYARRDSWTRLNMNVVYGDELVDIATNEGM
jgi:hypothetical protein